VTFPNGEKYVSDVAFGGDGPTRPLPLIDGHSQVNLGSQEVRLISSNLPNQRLQTPKYWFYQYRNKPEDAWNSFYAFPEIEFFDNDFIGMNWYTSTFVGGSNFQTTRVLIVQFIKGKVDGEEKERVTGKRMLVDGVVKRNDGGRTEVVQVCHNEAARVKAIEEDFGMELLPEEIQAIQGWKTELIDTETKVQLA
jgi:arylamine N-acetyltransferase